MQLPSASNTAGTLLGTLAGSAVATFGPTLPFVIAGAAALGVTPVALSALAAVVITGGVNYAVTHIAEVKNLNELVSDYWPMIEAKYPTGKNGDTTTVPVSNQPPNSNLG